MEQIARDRGQRADDFQAAQTRVANVQDENDRLRHSAAQLREQLQAKPAMAAVLDRPGSSNEFAQGRAQSE
eukprot:6416092-Karenia_brevis.AAC.1